MEYDASGYPIGCNPPPVLKIQVNAGKKINEKLSGFYISVSTISIPHAFSGNSSYTGLLKIGTPKNREFREILAFSQT